MAKSCSGYKRPSPHRQPTPAVRIPVTTEETWAVLTACAQANRCNVATWAETGIRYALSGLPYIGAPRRPASFTPLSPIRYFEISEGLFDSVAAKVGRERALQWIARTLLFLAEIELRRQHGRIREPDRNWV